MQFIAEPSVASLSPILLEESLNAARGMIESESEKRVSDIALDRVRAPDQAQIPPRMEP
jgi:hypothetical protein